MKKQSLSPGAKNALFVNSLERLGFFGLIMLCIAPLWGMLHGTAMDPLMETIYVSVGPVETQIEGKLAKTRAELEAIVADGGLMRNAYGNDYFTLAAGDQPIIYWTPAKKLTMEDPADLFYGSKTIVMETALTPAIAADLATGHQLVHNKPRYHGARNRHGWEPRWFFPHAERPYIWMLAGLIALGCFAFRLDPYHWWVERKRILASHAVDQAVTKGFQEAVGGLQAFGDQLGVLEEIQVVGTPVSHHFSSNGRMLLHQDEMGHLEGWMVSEPGEGSFTIWLQGEDGMITRVLVPSRANSVRLLVETAQAWAEQNGVPYHKNTHLGAALLGLELSPRFNGNHPVIDRVVAADRLLTKPTVSVAGTRIDERTVLATQLADEQGREVVVPTGYLARVARALGATSGTAPALPDVIKLARFQRGTKAHQLIAA